MALIPQLDTTVALKDAGYAVRKDEADTSVSLGCFHLAIVEPTPGTTETDGSLTMRSSDPALATYPVYNSQNSVTTDPTATQYLSAASKAQIPTDPSNPAPFNSQLSFDGADWYVFDVTNIAATGAIAAKAIGMPATINQNNVGAIALNITNPDQYALGGIFGINFTDNTRGVLLSALNLNTGFTDFLALRAADIAAANPLTWVNDGMPGVIGTASRSWPVRDQFNVQVDLTGAPTVTFYQVVYDYTTGAAPIQTISANGTGDLPIDPLNAFTAANAFWVDDRTSTNFAGPCLFGIDWSSGNNTGCWYCAIDASAFGHVAFTMPDASLGPSSDPTVYWVQRLTFGAFIGPGSAWNYYPQTDRTGNWFWLRAPLFDAGTGDMVIEPLTGEVYTTATAAIGAGRFIGTFTGIFSAGQFGGGTK